MPPKINTTTTYKVLHYQYLQGLYFQLPPEDRRVYKHTELKEESNLQLNLDYQTITVALLKEESNVQ